MNFKTIYSITFILLVILTIGAVSASDSADTLAQDSEDTVSQYDVIDNNMGEDNGLSSYNYENYTASDTDNQLASAKEDTNITAVFKDSKIVATLTDADGNPVGGAKVGFAYNDVKYILTDENGQANYSTSNLPSGDYTFKVAFFGNDNYNASDKQTVKFTLTKSTSKLAISSSISAYVNSGSYVLALLTDANGNPVSGAKIGFAYDTVTYISTDSNGKARYYLKNFTAGSYSIKVAFFGNDAYDASDKLTSKVVISKIGTNLASQDISIGYKSGDCLVATLTDADGNPVSGAKVGFAYNDVKYILTDENGQASYNCSDLDEGTHTIKMAYYGNDTYQASNKVTAKIVVGKIATKLAISSSISANVNSGSYVLALLTDANGNPVSGAKIGFAYDTVTYISTDSNGKARYYLKNFTEGSYSIKVAYFGNDTYSASDKLTSKVVVSKYATSLSVPDVQILNGTDGYLLATLTDGDGNPVSGAKIGFAYDDVTYILTDEKGQANYTCSNLDEGIHTVKVAYYGNDTYQASNKVAAKIIIGKIATKLTVTNLTTTYNSGKYITATLTDTSGNPVSGVNVAFAYKNMTYVSTDSSGKAKYYINNLAVGTYSIKVAFYGNDIYNASDKVTSIVTIITSSGQLLVSGKTTSASGAYSVSTSDKNTVLVQNGGKLTLTNSEITKTGDVSSSNSENSDFYGTNAAVLVTSKSTLNITDSKITTNANGANAIFVSNLASSASGATAYVSNVVINTYKDKSRGLDATYGGTITANNVTIYTRGGSCAALATDRGEGTVTATNCELYTGVGQTSGSGSPLIYSTGDITVSKSTGTSFVSQIACIEGKNSITLTDCDFVGYGKGNRYVSGSYVDLAGVFLYQSMSGDADVGASTFTATNTKLTISSSSSYYSSVPMFFVTNNAATINLKNCTLSFGSGVLLNAAGQSQWGTSGSNGGDVVFNAINMNLAGKMVIDKISTLKLTLTKTNYKGCINPSSSYGTTNVVVNSGSTWTLTGNSHVTSLSNSGTINYGSYTLYVNGVAYTASNPYKG